MRYILSIISLALLASCTDSSTKNETGRSQTAETDFLEQYEDFSGHFTSDGTKGVFTSLRDKSLAHAYLYDSAATPTLVRFDDRLGLVETEGAETFNALSPSAAWVAMSRVSTTTALNQLVVGHFTGTAKASIELAAGHSIDDLVFVKGSESYVAYVDRFENTRTLKIVQIAGDATAVTLTELNSFPNEFKPALTVLGTVLQVVSTDTSGVLDQVVHIRSFDEGSQVWTDNTDANLKTSLQDINRPVLLTQAGLFIPKTSTAGLTRKMLGSAASVATDTAERASILDDISQKDLFATALPYDWSAAPYAADQAATVASLSGTLDGQYLLTTGTDSISCTLGIRQLATIKLIRRSDMKIVTMVVARIASTNDWAELITQPCGIFDNTLGGGVARTLDATITRAELVGQDGEFWTVLLNSFARFDQELRLARFKIDWNAGTVSDVTITNVSANARP